MNKRLRPPSPRRAPLMAGSLRRMVAGPRSMALVVGALLLLVAAGVAADYWFGLPENAKATYVGRKSCIQCHQAEAKAWQNSHHDLAMDLATSDTVLADFDDQTLEHHDQTSRMFKRDGKYFVHTDGPDGKLADFEVKYVFGVTPLQQYMVEFDRPAGMPDEEISRVQVLRETWDTRQKRWFYQNPPDVQEKLEPGDELHWTGVTQRWNSSCADCHSTNLQKSFDLASRTYHTTWSEIDVSCEACHGPGSLHVQLAKSPSLFWDRKQGYALPKLKGESNLAEIQACAPCHSRRSSIHGDYASGAALHDFYATELLGTGIYHADGQIQDEVYEYGSFTQSKMHSKGVRCSDCHNPHSLRLKHPGNQLCTSCHAHPAGKYDAPAHHNHKAGSTGTWCIECHMPATTYMDVDPRRDHSLRIPRPDLSVKLGTPNACVSCHLTDSKLPPEQKPKSPSSNRPAEYADWLRAAERGDEPVKGELQRLNQWADAAVEKWFGQRRKKEPHFAEALLSARQNASGAQAKLLELLGNRNQPTVARATAALELGAFVDPQPGYSAEAIRALREALADKNPEIRAAAVLSLQNGPPQDILAALTPLLNDPARLVRIRAAQGLSRFRREDFHSEDYRTFQRVAQEYLAGAGVNNDRAAEHMMLGVFAENQGDFQEARKEYELAISLEPTMTGPRSNLAALLDQLARAANDRVRSAAQQPDEAAAVAAMQQRDSFVAEAAQLRRQELDLLEQGSLQVPENAEWQRRVGLLRHLQGWSKEAEAALLRAWLLQPRDPGNIEVLAVYFGETGRPQDALPLAERLLELRPQHPRYEQLRDDIRAKLK